MKEQFPLLVSALTFSLSVSSNLFPCYRSPIERLDICAIHCECLIAVRDHILGSIEIRIASGSIAEEDGKRMSSNCLSIVPNGGIKLSRLISFVAGRLKCLS